MYLTYGRIFSYYFIITLMVSQLWENFGSGSIYGKVRGKSMVAAICIREFSCDCWFNLDVFYASIVL